MSEALANASAAPRPDEGAGMSSGVVTLPLPRVFGRLLLLKLLARGGMGDVYLAATTGIEGAERPIVVKTVRRDHIHDGSFLARFLDEARVQSQLNHPGVAQVLEASTDDNGEPYTVVEYVEGRSLADVRHRAIQVGTRIGWPEAVSIAIEMGQALSHVHERAGADGSPLGIVHRDLSPQNVMVGYAGELKLIDFGTARGHNRRCHTVAGVVFAKPGYVAPEVARQQVGDGRIDVYAMGVMLWELCAGKRLLAGDPQAHLEDVAAGNFDLPRLGGTRDIPCEVDDIIRKLCANDPDDRYASAASAATDLARVLAAQAPAGKGGERSVRARIAALMKALWPSEPARVRAEFARLLKQARALRRDPETPPSERSMQLASVTAAHDPDALPGTPYRLREKIGEGSSGEVFQAEHCELGRRYAIKVLSAAHAAAVDAVERFRREARAIASLSHPNLVRLHDFGKSLDGRVFLVMELLHGKTLDEHIGAGLSWGEATSLAIQVARALEAAHAAGLVHRDLKPQNLFLTESGELKLLDFGVAMALADTADSSVRQQGFAVFGTPEYMAPEQVAGEPVDARCDIYSLGCVLYELVTGTRVFEGSPVVVMGKQLREAPEPPRARAPLAAIPMEIEAVIVRALAKSRDARFSSAQEMRDALEHALTAPARAAQAAKARKKAVFAAVGGAILAGIVAFAARERMTPVATQPTVAAAVSPLVAPAPAPAPAPDPDPDPAEAPAPPPEPKAAVAAAAPVPPPAVAAPAPAPAPPSPAVSPEEPAPSSLLVRASAHHAPTPSRSELKASLNDARTLAKDHTTDPQALRGWALAALQAGETKEARRAAEAWATHDGGVEPRLVLATALEAAGRRREARAVLEEWLANHPDTPEARKMLQRMGGSPDPAIKHGTHGRSTLRPHASRSLHTADQVADGE